MIQTMENSTSSPRVISPLHVDMRRVRRDFPVLEQKVKGKPLIYLDNAATSQMPRVVGEVMERFHTHYRSNVHRGVHTLSQEASEAYEGARTKLRKFLGAAEDREVLFVRGATEAINLVMHSFGRPRVKEGDEVLVSAMEHHSNIVPWQMLCEENRCTLRVIPMNEKGELILEEYERLLSPRTKLVAVTHVSNALGTINPVKWMIEKAHAVGAKVLVDGAQAVPHMPVDVRDLDADFYAVSGHKMFGPLGIGVLYGKAALLQSMPPFHGGGSMIRTVTFEKTLYADIPARFEAGTPNISGTIGLGAAVEYLGAIGMARIAAYEAELTAYATESLGRVDGVRLVGTADEKAAVLSFVVDGVHPHDLGTILDDEGIAIRTGHHCAQPVMDFFRVPATARASLAFYNTFEEIDVLCRGVRKAIEVFR